MPVCFQRRKLSYNRELFLQWHVGHIRLLVTYKAIGAELHPTILWSSEPCMKEIARYAVQESSSACWKNTLFQESEAFHSIIKEALQPA